MIRSKIISLAIALIVLSVGHANVIMKPKAPVSLIFAKDHIHASVHAARAKNFKGTFKGRFSMFGNKGTYSGTMGGMTKDNVTSGDVSGSMRGDVDMLGTKGKLMASFAGDFNSKPMGSGYRVKYGGSFDFEYKGVYDGKEHYGKAVGSYSGDVQDGKFVMKERGMFNVRLAGKILRGSYTGRYDGETVSATVVGTFDGKRMRFSYKFMLEDIEKMITNEGSYDIMHNGKKKTGTFKGWDMLPK